MQQEKEVDGVGATSSHGELLLSLAPSYDKDAHASYVEALAQALNDDSIRNIALSGNYGVGKSSILRQFAKDNERQVVELSLSTLDPSHAPVVDDALPKQAGTTTNRIQQEIVKQLLYGVRPEAMAGSRFRRIEQFRWLRACAIASLLGAGAAVAFLLAGWTQKVAQELHFSHLNSWKIHLVTFCVFSICALLSHRLSHGRFYVKQLSAGSASVTLDDRSVSYFDQYLDEIVHFFQTAKRTIVIFEDIDRFEDPYIFETLRSLNALLNNAPELKRPIRFVYALRDSIFDAEAKQNKRSASTVEGAAKANTGSLSPAAENCVSGGGAQFATTRDDHYAVASDAAFNRAKFFDLIVPVVPFITHLSARDLATQLLSNVKHDVKQELVDIAVRFVPDMRVLKNVRNEFLIFRKAIYSGRGKELQLSQTGIFAMMLYKSMHLSDFEKIRIGSSNLDVVYRKYRTLVQDGIKSIDANLVHLQGRIASQGEVEGHAKRLGTLLATFYSKLAAYSSYDSIDSGTFSMDGVNYTMDELSGVDFWRTLSRKMDARLEWVSQRAQVLSLSGSQIALEIGSFDIGEWSRGNDLSLQKQVSDLSADLRFVRSADICNLFSRPEFTVAEAGVALTMSDLVREVMGSGLAYELLRAGHIDRTFTLYTSIFHGHRSGPAATNFLIHNVSPLISDPYFVLSPDDVKVVLLEKGSLPLADPTFYNVSIFDCALSGECGNDASIELTDSLSALGDEQRQFFQIYATSGAHPELLVAMLSARNTSTINILINEVDLGPVDRMDLVSASLSNLGSVPPDTHDAGVAAYLSQNIEVIPAFFDDALGEVAAGRLIIFLRAQGVLLPSLSAVSSTLRSAAMAANLFDITTQNVVLVCGDSTSLSLNRVKGLRSSNYQYFLRNSKAYLSAIEGRSPSIDSVDEFASVLHDLSKVDSSAIEAVSGAASKACVLSDLNLAPVKSWRILAKQRRFRVTFRNVDSYVTEIGHLDSELGVLISAHEVISELEDVSQEDRAGMALLILESDDTLGPSSNRVKLASSLDLSEYLDASDVPAEDGALMAELVLADLVEDSPDAYERLRQCNWQSREILVNASKNFPSYMTPELVKGDVGRLLASTSVSKSVKDIIMGSIDVYASVSTDNEVAEIAKYAISQNAIVPPSLIERFAKSLPSREQLLSLIAPQAKALTKEQLISMVKLLPGEYSKLTSTGYSKARIPHTLLDEMVLERLREVGIVNSFPVKKGRFEVFKKRK